MLHAKSFGIGIGIMVGIIISIFVIKAINKDGKFKTKYDEMQQIARGKAYKYGFWSILAYEALMCVLTSDDFFVLPFNNFTLHFTAVMVGVLVQVTYCIWNNAYIGLNTTPGRFAAFCIGIAIFNFVIAFAAIANGNMFAEGKLQEPFMNLIVGVLFIIIGVELFIKRVVDGTAKEE